MSEKYMRINRRFKSLTGGFSLVELLVVVVIIGILSGVSLIGVSQVKRRASNEKMLDDLLFIANALEDYRRDHNQKLPIPEPSTDPLKKITQNVLCFYKDATYAHDCDQAEFVQGMIDNNLLSKRYLREVPTDPRTGSRYIYGVSKDRQYFQVAGVYDKGGGVYQARMAGNLVKGYELPSIVRAFDGPNFVINGEKNLPYNPSHLSLIGALQEVKGTVMVTQNKKTEAAEEGMIVEEGAQITTAGDGRVAIYLSDGSITQLDNNSDIALTDLSVGQNDKNGTATKVLLTLKKGKIWNKVARLAKGSTYEIESGGTIAGVRGTEFGVDANTGKTEVLAGEVSIKGTSKVIKDNQEWDGSSIKKLQNAPSIVGRYYKDIPLHTGIEPHVLKAAGDQSKGTLQIRNVNYYVNEVNQNQPNRSGRKMVANRLAIYKDDGTTLLKAVDISNQPKAVYDISDTKLLGENLKIRFEQCANNSDLVNPCKGSNLESSSRFNDEKLKIDPTTNLDEKTLYPNKTANQKQNPKLDLSTPSIITADESEFKLKFEVLHYSQRTLKKIEVSQTTTSVCTAPSNITPANPATITIKLTKKAGNCDLTVSTELDDNNVLQEKLSVQIVNQGQRLFLKLPANGSSLNKQNQRVTLTWETPNITTGAKFNVKVTGPKGPIPMSNQTGYTYTQYQINTPILTDPGTYTWEISMDYNGKQETTKPFTFTINKTLGANFDVFDPQKNAVTFNNDAADFPSKTQSARFEISVPQTIQQLINREHANAIYDWSGSTPPVTVNKTNPWQGVIEIDKTQLASKGDSAFAKINLTIRDKNKNIVGNRTKKMTVKYLPEIKTLSFDFNSASLQPKNDGTPWKIPKILINGGTESFEADECHKLTSSSSGDITGKDTYSIKSGALSEGLTCVINQNKPIEGFMVYPPQTQVSASNISVTFNQPAPTQTLAQLCKGKGGVFENSGCWFVAKKTTESCNDVCVTQNSLKCVDNQNWTISQQLCTDLGNVGNLKYTLNTQAHKSDFSPVLIFNECKNDNDNIHSCSQPAKTPYNRICKCTQ